MIVELRREALRFVGRNAGRACAGLVWLVARQDSVCCCSMLCLQVLSQHAVSIQSLPVHPTGWCNTGTRSVDSRTPIVHMHACMRHRCIRPSRTPTQVSCVYKLWEQQGNIINMFPPAAMDGLALSLRPCMPPCSSRGSSTATCAVEEV